MLVVGVVLYLLLLYGTHAAGSAVRQQSASGRDECGSGGAVSGVAIGGITDE